jgi:phosphoglycerate dehydrogenase-like enzyme
MYSHPSVRLSPHVSWNWSGAFQAMYATFIDNLRLYLNDEPLLSVVNPADGY